MAQTLLVSDDLYERLRNAATATQQPLEEVTRRVITQGLPPRADDLPEATREDLGRLEALTDDELWAIWHGLPDAELTERHATLLAANAEGALTRGERSELRQLRGDADRRLLRRACAAALLRWRGHSVPVND
jgi:hypothetical protein